VPIQLFLNNCEEDILPYINTTHQVRIRYLASHPLIFTYLPLTFTHLPLTFTHLPLTFTYILEFTWVQWQVTLNAAQPLEAGLEHAPHVCAGPLCADPLCAEPMSSEEEAMFLTPR
jgi:hypothetical protein